jgi:hypothetical protein
LLGYYKSETFSSHAQCSLPLILILQYCKILWRLECLSESQNSGGAGGSHCTSSFFEGTDQEDRRIRPGWANSLWNPISKIPNKKRSGEMVQVLEHLFIKCETLSSPVPKKKKKFQNSILKNLNHRRYSVSYKRCF